MKKLKKKTNYNTASTISVKKKKKKEEKEPKITSKRTLKSKRKRNEGVDADSGKKRLRKRFKKQRCMFRKPDGTQCKRYAVGKSTLCSFHGGNRIVKDNLVPYSSALVPTKFNPSIHPIQFIESSRMGMSDVEIAAQFEVGIETLRSWADTFEEFAIAYEVGQAMYEAWFLNTGRRNLSNTRFNTSLFKFITGNKLGYTEKIESKNFNANVNHGVLLVPNSMTVDEWEAANAAEDAKKKQKHTEETIDADYTEVKTEKDS